MVGKSLPGKMTFKLRPKAGWGSGVKRQKGNKKFKGSEAEQRIGKFNRLKEDQNVLGAQ